MSQMDSALTFLNEITTYQIDDYMAVSNEDLTTAVASAARYVVQALTPEKLSEAEITERATLLTQAITEAATEGLIVDALSFCEPKAEAHSCG